MTQPTQGPLTKHDGRIFIRLEAEMRDAIRDCAKGQGLSMSQFIRNCLRQGLIEADRA